MNFMIYIDNTRKIHYSKNSYFGFTSQLSYLKLYDHLLFDLNIEFFGTLYIAFLSLNEVNAKKFLELSLHFEKISIFPLLKFKESAIENIRDIGIKSFIDTSIFSNRGYNLNLSDGAGDYFYIMLRRMDPFQTLRLTGKYPYLQYLEYLSYIYHILQLYDSLTCKNSSNRLYIE